MNEKIGFFVRSEKPSELSQNDKTETGFFVRSEKTSELAQNDKTGTGFFVIAFLRMTRAEDWILRSLRSFTMTEKRVESSS